MSGDIEKLMKSFGYMKSCMVLGSDGEVDGHKIDNQEELAFKLSVLFDLDNLEEIIIEKEDGACYIKLFDDRLVYFDCNKKPNTTLLNMYLKRIFGKKDSGAEAGREDGGKAKEDKGEEKEEPAEDPEDEIVALMVSEQFEK